MNNNYITPFGNAWVDSIPNVFNQLSNGQVTRRSFCKILEQYYFSNGLYRQAETGLRNLGVWQDGIKPLRNPTYRTVEFHVSHTAVGILGKEIQIVTEFDNIIDPIKQIWKWSNWNLKQKTALRYLTLYGDLFIKVVSKTLETDSNYKRIYFQLLNTGDVTDVEHDERGNLTYCRIDTQYLDAEGKSRVETEIWDNRLKLVDGTIGNFVKYDNEDKGSVIPVEELVNPIEEITLEEMLIDFIPIIHAKAFDVGLDFGVPAIWQSVDKIDELNKVVTTLHQRAFRHNKPLWAMASSTPSGTGKAVPPPLFVRQAQKITGGATDAVNFDGEKIINLPANMQLSSLVPNLDYNSLLAISTALLEEIEQDLPELKYGSINQIGTSGISGRVVRLLLSDAVDRALTVRASYEESMVRANQIALTLGSNLSLWNVGEYAEGQLDHDFNDRPVIPSTEYEDAETVEKWTLAGLPLNVAVKRVGWTQPEIDELNAAMLAEQTAQQQVLRNGLATDRGSDIDGAEDIDNTFA